MAKDDLAVRDGTLAFFTVGCHSSLHQQLVVLAYPQATLACPAVPIKKQSCRFTPARNRFHNRPRAIFPSRLTSGQRQIIEYLWQLEPLRLAPGMQVVFQAMVSDYLPQTTRSEPRRLNVVTPDELEHRIADRQNLLLSELNRVLKRQCSSRLQVEAIRNPPGRTKRPEQPELDLLCAAELGQRQVNSVLSNRSEGILSHVVAIQADLENNRIDNPDIKRHLDPVMAEIDRLQREYLPDIGREFTSAMKSAEIVIGESTFRRKRSAEVGAALASAGKTQDQVI